jgi:hypothetical protein
MSIAPLTNSLDSSLSPEVSFDFDLPQTRDLSIQKESSIYAQSIPKDPIEPLENKSSRFFRFFSDWSTVIDLNDCIQGITRSVLNQIKYYTSDTVAKSIEKVSYVSATSCAIVGFAAKSVALREAIDKSLSAFVYGSLVDKMDSLANLVRSLVSFLSASLGVLTAISAAIFKEVLGLPLILLKLVSLTFSLVKSLYRFIQMMLILRKINKLENGSTNREKLENVLKEFKAVKDAVDLENNVIRVNASNKDDIESFIKDRTNGVLSRTYGLAASKLIEVKVDGQVVHERLLRDLTFLDEQKSKATACEIEIIEAKEAMLVQEGLKFVQDIKASIYQNELDTVPMLIGSLLGIGSSILSLVFAPALIPLTLLALNLTSGASFGLISLKAYFASARVLKNEKDWMLHILVKALVNELKQSEDPKDFVRRYGFNTEASDKEEIIKQFKTFIRTKIQETGLEKEMNFSILSSLRDIKEDNIGNEVQLSSLYSNAISKLQESDVISDKPADRYVQFFNQLKEKNAFKALLTNTPRNIDRIHRRILAI